MMGLGNGYGYGDEETGNKVGYDNNNDAYNVSTECKNFSKRRDINIFNMSDYRSCENCVHMSAENRCMK